MEVEKIKTLTLREINEVDAAIAAVGGLSFPPKFKYKLGKIKNQLGKYVRSYKETRSHVQADAIKKFKLAIDKQTGEPIWTVGAQEYVEKAMRALLETEEKLDSHLYPILLSELFEAESYLEDWNNKVKTAEQPAVAISSQVYQLLDPVILDDNGQESKRKPN